MKADIKSFHPEIKSLKSARVYLGSRDIAILNPTSFHPEFNSFSGTLTPFRFKAWPSDDARTAACYGFSRQHCTILLPSSLIYQTKTWRVMTCSVAHNSYISSLSWLPVISYSCLLISVVYSENVMSFWHGEEVYIYNTQFVGGAHQMYTIL